MKYTHFFIITVHLCMGFSKQADAAVSSPSLANYAAGVILGITSGVTCHIVEQYTPEHCGLGKYLFSWIIVGGCCRDIFVHYSGYDQNHAIKLDREARETLINVLKHYKNAHFYSNDSLRLLCFDPFVTPYTIMHRIDDENEAHKIYNQAFAATNAYEAIFQNVHTVYNATSWIVYLGIKAAHCIWQYNKQKKERLRIKNALQQWFATHQLNTHHDDKNQTVDHQNLRDTLKPESLGNR